MNVSVYDCSVIELPKITDRSGNITPVEGIRNLPFDINGFFILMIYQGGKQEEHMPTKPAINFW